MQEFKTGATRQNMETTHMKEETKRLRSQLGELRDKLADLDAKVNTNNDPCWSVCRSCMFITPYKLFFDTSTMRSHGTACHRAHELQLRSL